MYKCSVQLHYMYIGLASQGGGRAPCPSLPSSAKNKRNNSTTATTKENSSWAAPGGAIILGGAYAPYPPLPRSYALHGSVFFFFWKFWDRINLP